MSRPVPLFFRIEKTANSAQLTGIQPKASTTRTFIDLDFLLDAEEVPHHDHAAAFRTAEPLGMVDCDALVSFDFQ